jgi:hypothetical protein
MARITFTHRSIRTAVGTAAVGVVVAMVLGACGSSTQGVLTPVNAASASSAAAPVAAVPAEPEAPADPAENVAPEPSPEAKKKTPVRSVAPAPRAPTRAGTNREPAAPRRTTTDQRLTTAQGTLGQSWPE